MCIPAEQQSWSGKAMSRWGDVRAHRGWEEAEAEKMVREGRPLWCLVRGATPATACHLGLTQREIMPPFAPDLVVSGPNWGRNAGRSCILSSGTVAAALEAVIQGVPAVAVSVAYGRPAADEGERRRQLQDACRLAVRAVMETYDAWEEGTPLYNINLPLGADPDAARLRRTHVLQDSYGTIFRPAAAAADSSDAAPGDDAKDSAAAAQLARLGASGGAAVTFRFGSAQDFGKLRRFEDTPGYEGSDIWALAEGHVSVTALRGTLAEC